MIEPYGTVLKSFIPRFSAIGLSRSGETDYSMIFSGGPISLEISTERYNHPSLSTRLLDDKGSKFSMRIIREVLSPEQLAADSAELCNLKRIYRLDDVISDDDARKQGMAAYCKLAVEQLLDFLSSHEEVLSSLGRDLREKYAAAEDAALRDFGGLGI